MAEQIKYKEFEEFYHLIDNLNVRGELRQNKRQELQKEVQKFHSASKSLQFDTIKNKEIRKTLQDFLDEMQHSIQLWVKRFEKRAKQEEFEERFRDKFIVFIFGKVKAGKSTLGNFIAQNKLDGQDIDYKIYDSTNKERQLEISEFATNITECTVEIQLFTLGGLAWVDTPGLNSMTPENGELAKKYIGAADFIIYPTNSASPMQAEEIDEIKSLLNHNKPIHILITRSDEPEEDQDENGQIIYIFENKTTHVREEQQKDAMERLKKALNSEQRKLIQDEILSISVEAAKRGLKDNDLELFRNSNVPQFYAQFNSILRNKAQILKEQSPLQSLVVLIDKILEGVDEESKQTSLAATKKEYEKLVQSLKDKQQEFDNSMEDLKSEIPKIIQQKLEPHKIDRKDYTQQLKNIAREVGKEIESKSTQICQKAIEDFASDLTKSMESLQIDEIRDKTREHKIPKKNGWGKAIGGIGGTIVGGIFGAGIGIAVGGIVGTAIGEGIDRLLASEQNITITTGNNKEEVIGKFRNDLEIKLQDNLKTCKEEVEQDFFKPLSNQLKKVEIEIATFRCKLEHIKTQYQQTRS